MGGGSCHSCLAYPWAACSGGWPTGSSCAAGFSLIVGQLGLNHAQYVDWRASQERFRSAAPLSHTSQVPLVPCPALLLQDVNCQERQPQEPHPISAGPAVCVCLLREGRECWQRVIGSERGCSLQTLTQDHSFAPCYPCACPFPFDATFHTIFRTQSGICTVIFPGKVVARKLCNIYEPRTEAAQGGIW